VIVPSFEDREEMRWTAGNQVAMKQEACREEVMGETRGTAESQLEDMEVNEEAIVAEEAAAGAGSIECSKLIIFCIVVYNV
jgi:hypothetical protein